MKKPGKPANELERLEKLYSYDILDTDPEEEYERITEIASHIAGTSVALVTLIDDERQWIKASVGSDLKQTTRDDSFCAHLVESGEELEVHDATTDERFHDNPYVVKGPSIRFYRGAPLKAKGGEVVGSLCVIDEQPRQLDDTQRRMLDHLAATVVDLLEARRLALQLSKSEQLVRRLYRTSQRDDLEPEARWNAFLELGCDLFDMEAGILSRFDGQDHQIETLVAPASFGYILGDYIFDHGSILTTVRDKSEPYFRRDINKQEQQSLPEEEHAWRSAVTIPIFSNGAYAGSVAFVSTQSRERPFSDSDVEEANLMGVWIGAERHRHRAEQERKALVEALTAKVRQLDTLHGLLPICSYCKQIRDEEGAWQQIENFVSTRSGADFSHSICPCCYDENIVSDVG